MVQTLAGDQTDGYGGVPGIGVKAAAALFFERHGYTWKTVLKHLKRRDLMKMSPSLTPALPRSLPLMIMTSNNDDQSYGLPPCQ